MLGIIIGIASVIAIVSIGEGTKNQMNSEIDDIGGGQIAVYCSDDATADDVWIQPEDIDAVGIWMVWKVLMFQILYRRDSNRKRRF